MPGGGVSDSNETIGSESMYWAPMEQNRKTQRRKNFISCLACIKGTLSERGCAVSDGGGVMGGAHRSGSQSQEW